MNSICISFQVTKVTILTGIGTDNILFEVIMPDGCYPYDPKRSTVEMRAARGQGLTYVLEHFAELKDLITVVQRG